MFVYCVSLTVSGVSTKTLPVRSTCGVGCSGTLDMKKRGKGGEKRGREEEGGGGRRRRKEEEKGGREES